MQAQISESRCTHHTPRGVASCVAVSRVPVSNAVAARDGCTPTEGAATRPSLLSDRRLLPAGRLLPGLALAPPSSFRSGRMGGRLTGQRSNSGETTVRDAS